MKNITVIGSGTMGNGIAHTFAQFGYNVNLVDINEAALQKAIATITKNLDRQVQKASITEEVKLATLKNITTLTDLVKGAANADLVVEAASENLDVKLKIFKQLDEICQPNTILASNTSSISITQIAAVTKRADKVIGMHFMNPVPVMKLVEVIRGLQTSDETFAAVKKMCEAMDKTLVKGIDGPGFVVNRILCPMINEAIFVLQEGVSAEDIDNAMKLGTNQPMGPLTLADFVGLDTLLYILRILHSELGEDKYRPCPLLIKYVEAGWYGKKSGKGFYTY